jgi:NTE family protein
MFRIPRAVFFAFMFLATAAAQQTVPSQRPVVGIALEGGGALGLAHIGVLQWMEEHRIPIDRLSGTSMGSLIGGLYASGSSPEDLRKIALGSDLQSVFTLETPYSASSFRRREDRRETPSIVSVGLKNRTGLRNSLLTDGGLNQFLDQRFFSYNSTDIDFDALPIPFRCVATDLTTLEPRVFRSGPLPQALRASVSIPGVFAPVKAADGHFLVDGGIVDNLPTDVLRGELHADVVIAVHLETGKMTASDIGSIVNVLNRAFAAGVALNETQSKKLANVVLNVPLGSYSTTSYDKGEDLIRAGYATAEANRDALLRYAVPEAEWQAYLAARSARIHVAPGVLRAVRVEGGDSGATHEVRDDLQSAEGKILTANALQDKLRDVQADGEYKANYETFALHHGDKQDDGVLVRLSKEPGGPPFLLVSPSVQASTSNVTRGELTLRLVDQGLGGYGSEFRATGSIGYLTDLTAEYYRELTHSSFFIQPQVHVLRQPVYIWANQKRIAERFQQNLEAGVEAGRTVGNSLQVAAAWNAIDTHWSLRTGSDGGGYLAGTAQTGLLRITLDRATSGSISPDGMRFSLAAGAFYHAVGSDNAPLVQASFARTHPFLGKNILGVGMDVNSYLRARVADPFRFTLGGPLRLSASSFDEFRGTDTMLARAGLMHRLAALPTGIGQGLYAVMGYEAGEIWSPERRAILRQDGNLGLVAATPIGVITFGGSVGDAGHRKVFVSVGRWF